MMNMFLAYVANVSDNLHAFAAITLLISWFIFLWSWMPTPGDTTLFERYVKPNAKLLITTAVILFAIYLLTPSNWKHDMDMQYIHENGQLRRELNDVTIQLQKCEMRRGQYCDNETGY